MLYNICKCNVDAYIIVYGTCHKGIWGNGSVAILIYLGNRCEWSASRSDRSSPVRRNSDRQPRDVLVDLCASLRVLEER